MYFVQQPGNSFDLNIPYIPYHDIIHFDTGEFVQDYFVEARDKGGCLYLHFRDPDTPIPRSVQRFVYALDPYSIHLQPGSRVSAIFRPRHHDLVLKQHWILPRDRPYEPGFFPPDEGRSEDEFIKDNWMVIMPNNDILQEVEWPSPSSGLLRNNPFPGLKSHLITQAVVTPNLHNEHLLITPYRKFLQFPTTILSGVMRLRSPKVYTELPVLFLDLLHDVKDLNHLPTLVHWLTEFSFSTILQGIEAYHEAIRHTRLFLLIDAPHLAQAALSDEGRVTSEDDKLLFLIFSLGKGVEYCGQYGTLRGIVHENGRVLGVVEPSAIHVCYLMVDSDRMTLVDPKKERVRAPKKARGPLKKSLDKGKEVLRPLRPSNLHNPIIID